MKIIILIISTIISISCSSINTNCKSDDENQFIKIYLKTGKYDIIDTFNGRLVKDLVPDTVVIPFSFSKREQEIIKVKVTDYILSQLPDTINPQDKNGGGSNSHLGPTILRIKTDKTDKTIIAYYPFTSSEIILYDPYTSIIDLIITIVKSKKEYKELPDRKGAYL